MYTKIKIKSRIRVAPSLFSKDINEAVSESISQEFEGKLDLDNGLFLSLIDVESIGEGIIVSGDGAVFYETVFNLLAYMPLIQEIVEGEITEIAEFGAFVKIGPMEGLIHKSQIMDDFISYSKTRTLAGKESKRVLKAGDKVKARVISAGIKELMTAKIGLTMRQEGLGVTSWAKESKKKESVAE